MQTSDMGVVVCFLHKELNLGWTFATARHKIYSKYLQVGWFFWFYDHQ